MDRHTGTLPVGTFPSTKYVQETYGVHNGTAVCLVIQRDTIQTAKLVASLDRVSKGRFLFGIIASSSLRR